MMLGHETTSSACNVEPMDSGPTRRMQQLAQELSCRFDGTPTDGWLMSLPYASDAVVARPIRLTLVTVVSKIAMKDDMSLLTSVSHDKQRKHTAHPSSNVRYSRPDVHHVGASLIRCQSHKAPRCSELVVSCPSIINHQLLTLLIRIYTEDRS